MKLQKVPLEPLAVPLELLEKHMELFEPTMLLLQPLEVLLEPPEVPLEPRLMVVLKERKVRTDMQTYSIASCCAIGSPFFFVHTPQFGFPGRAAPRS